MTYNGSGTFVRPVSSYVFNTVISETDMNTEMDGMATGLSTAITKDGQTTITANIPMAMKKFTGLGAGSAATDSVNLGQVQASAYNFIASDTGAADAYVIAPSPAITAYAAGQNFKFVAANASTGSATINVSSLGTKAIQYQGAAIGGADIKAGSTINVEYDGTQFQMISPSNSTGAGDMLAANNLSDVASAATSRVNLGLAIGSDVEAFDVDILKAGTNDILTAGFAGTDDDDGTKSSGTYTPIYTGGNFKKIVNGGAFTLAPMALTSSLVVQMTNNASAGAITTSGWTIVTGDSITTTNADNFMLYLNVVNAFKHLHITALQ